MTEHFDELTVRPVGYVRSPVKESPPGDDWWQELVSEIVIDENLEEALEEIEFYRYLVILYWLHKRDRENIALKVNPKGRKDIPMRGIFATRTPDRINPIVDIQAETTVRPWPRIAAEARRAIPDGEHCSGE